MSHFLKTSLKDHITVTPLPMRRGAVPVCVTWCRCSLPRRRRWAGRGLDVWTAETPGGQRAMCVPVSVFGDRQAAEELENFTAFRDGHS